MVFFLVIQTTCQSILSVNVKWSKVQYKIYLSYFICTFDNTYSISHGHFSFLTLSFKMFKSAKYYRLITCYYTGDINSIFLNPVFRTKTLQITIFVYGLKSIVPLLCLYIKDQEAWSCKSNVAWEYKLGVNNLIFHNKVTLLCWLNPKSAVFFSNFENLWLFRKYSIPWIKE